MLQIRKPKIAHIARHYIVVRDSLQRVCTSRQTGRGKNSNGNGKQGNKTHVDDVCLMLRATLQVSIQTQLHNQCAGGVL